MEQLSYNSTATSGLHCNHMLHAIDHSVFATPFTIWLQQGNQQCYRSVVVIPISEEKIIFEKQNCEHMHTH
jgi:hypothetical protein